MFKIFLILVFTGWIIQYVTMTRESVCRQASVKKEPCINGKRNIKITNFIKENGVCRPFPTKTNLYCGLEKKDFCKCSAVGGLHYRTYDGQGIHFYGDCRYTLSKHSSERDSCSFNIEVQNHFGGKQSVNSYARSIIIHMFGEKYELGPRRSLKIGNVKRSIPYEKDTDVRIFYSNDFVQFVAPKCSVRVAFNGKSNAFVTVSRKYSGKMNGICGNCNGLHDDFKTKSGKDVSKKKNRFARIANSYKVSNTGKNCRPAAQISYKNICGRHFDRENKQSICQDILTNKNPFRNCGQQAFVDLKSFYEDCLLDLCINKNRPHKAKIVQCQILEGLAESCSESGVPGIGWRTHFNCQKKCGKNQHFSQKASPCPRTCENHFFGTQRPCYDLPEREGCECNKGYIRDGALCVKPTHCKCMSLCTDRKNSKSCRKWKLRGDCEKFQEPMNVLCPRTCGFCKIRDITCENEISTKRCLSFRRKGLCFHEFYRSICGLTCNFEKCKCGNDETVIGKCDKKTNIITTYYYSYTRDSKGRCVKLVRHTYEACECPKGWIQKGRCNFCTGKRNITSYTYKVHKYKCVLQSYVRYETCEKCLENARTSVLCDNDRYLRTIVTFNKVVGCYQCVPDKRIGITEVKCKSTKKVKSKGCTKYIRIETRTPKNCRCHVAIKFRRKKVCCLPKPPTTVECKNKIFIQTIRFYKLIKGECYLRTSYKDLIPKCPIKNIRKFSKCIREKNGSFYCKANDVQEISGITKKCKCFRKLIKRPRICCCPESYQYKKCNRQYGIITTVTVKYNLIKNCENFRCVPKEFPSYNVVTYTTRYSREKGTCQPNHKTIDKIWKTFRDGCKIKTTFYRHQVFNCCRIPKRFVITKCVFQTRVVTEFERILKKNQCVNVQKSRKEFPVVCPGKKEVTSKCVKNAKTITTTSYYVANCRCRKLENVQIVSPCCKRKVISEKVSACNHNTRLASHITISLGEDCEYQTIVCPVICKCQDNEIRSYCNVNTGQIVTSTKIFHYNRKYFKCNTKTSTKFRSIKCKEARVVKHRCGQERNNYRKITIITEHLNKNSCSCKRKERVIWKCCKLPKTTTKSKCRGNYFELEITSYKFGKNRNKCVREISRRIRIIKCPPIARKYEIVFITRCRYKQFTYYYRIENCECQRKRSAKVLFKCCDKPEYEPRTITKCIGNKYFETRFVNFRLSPDRTKCNEYSTTSTKLIFCRSHTRTHITPRSSDCTYSIITKYYQVKNCKCRKVKTKTQNKLWCCTKKPMTKVSCVASKIWRITTRTYTLVNDEKCIKKKTNVDKVIKCQDPYSVVCPCAKWTHLKSIKRFYYEVVGCKCKRLMKYFPCICHKVPNRVRVGKCNANGMRTVRVFKSVLVHEHCKWEYFTSYQDCCKCSKDLSKTICLAHSIWRTTKISCHQRQLMDPYPRHQCVKSKMVNDKNVGCNRDYTYVTPCINHVKRKIQCTYRKFNCKCELSCRQIALRRCPCNAWDKCREKCIRNVKYSRCKRYRAVGMRCVLTKTSLPKVEHCSPERKTKCTLQKAYRNNCLYTLCKTKFFIYQDCRCVPDKIFIDRCTKCRKPFVTLSCVNNRRVITTTSFVHKNNQCVQRKTQTFFNKECPRWRAQSTMRHGYSYYRITYYIKINCKCIKKICQERYFRKRCPVSKAKKQCIRNHWVYTFVNRHIQFTNRRLCPEIDTGIKGKICIENIKRKYQPIICHRDFKIIKCDVHKKIKIVEKHIFRSVNCQCSESVIIQNSRSCRNCPAPITHETACGRINKNGIGYIFVYAKFWAVNKDNKCVLRHEKSKKIGCCRKRHTVEVCENGQKKHKTFHYAVISKCQPRITVIAMSIHCYNNGRPNHWKVVNIKYCRRPEEFTIKYLERMKFNPLTCTCHRQTKSVKIGVCCDPSRFRTECRRNDHVVHITIHHRDINLKCVTQKSEQTVIMRCSRDQTTVIGDCKGTLIRYRIATFRAINCRCFKKVRIYEKSKITDRVECVSNMWRRTHIGYELVRNRCVTKRPFITFKRIVCSKAETYQDLRINSCNFWRSYYVNVVSNCRCVKKFIRKEVLHYRCCKKPFEFRRCVQDKTTEIHKTKYNLVNFRCYPVRNVIRIPVCCCHIRTVDRISTGKCTFNLLKYLVIKKNCKCVRILKKTIRNLCRCSGHLKPKKERRCDAFGGRHLTIDTSYKCVNRKILTVTKVTATPVNCNGRICKKIYSRCIHNTQTIQLLCLRREGCHCVKKLINQRNVCCGPRKDSTWTETGPCSIVRQKCHYRLVKTFALKLNLRRKTCQPVIINQQHKICRIPNPFTVQSCLNHIYIKKVFVSYKLNEKHNVCDEKKQESVSLVPGCHVNRKIKLSEKVTDREGYCEAKYKIIYPRNCKCHEKIKFMTFKHCSCYKRPPTVKTYSYCSKNYIRVMVTKTPKCILSTINWVVTKRFYPIYKCSHKEIIYGQRFRCGTSTRFNRQHLRRRYWNTLGGRNSLRMRYCKLSRYETHLQWFIQKCVCRNKITWQGPKCIECSPSHETKQCQGSRKTITRFSYSLVKGTCRKSVSREVVHIPCPRSPKVIRSRCHNNHYTLTTISYYYQNCQCMSRAVKKVCHCKCPSTNKVIRCSKNYLLNEITTKYHKQNCKCVKTETMRQILPSCPQLVPQTIGSCVLKRKNHIYRKVTKRHLRRDTSSCRCSVAVDEKLRICQCHERMKKRKFCINNHFIHQTLKWVINENKNKCELRVFKSHTESIVCPKTTSYKRYKLNSEIGKLVTVSYRLINCKCIRRIRETPIPCPFKKPPVLVKTGHCPPCSHFRDSIRFDTYKRHVVRNNECVPLMEKREEICCCRLPRTAKFCRINHFVNLYFTYKLIGKVCRKEVTKRNDFVNCPTGLQRTERSKCLHHGYRILYDVYKVVQNCKCHDYVAGYRYCRCRCPPARVKVTCDKCGSQIVTTNISYKLSDCKCIKMKTTRRKPVKCPPSHKETSKCVLGQDKNYVKTTTITNYVVTNCKCRQRQHKTKIICCKIEKKTEVHCDTKRQMEVTTISQVVFRSDKCILLKYETRLPIKCNGNWRLVNRPKCHPDGIYGKEIRMYQRLVFNKCGCLVRTRTKVCDCKCTGPSVIEKCAGNVIFKHHYIYKLHKCKCLKILTSIKRKSIHCENKSPKEGPCLLENGKFVKYVEYRKGVVSNCKCTIHSKTNKEPCVGKCGDPVTERRCDRKTNQLITKTKSCHVSKCGCIYYKIRRKTSTVYCEAKEECKTRSGCHPSTNVETIDCQKTFLENCLCQTKQESRTGPCVCGSSTTKYGPCNAKSCLREVLRVEHKLVSLKNGKKECQSETTKIKDEVCCCCQKSTTTEKCTGNKLIQTINTYTFNDREKQCELSTKTNDLTPDCGPSYKEIIESCDPRTRKRKIREIRTTLTNCKCEVKESIRTKVCLCLPDKSEEKCIENQLVTYFYFYSLPKDGDECDVKVTTSKKLISCPEEKSEISNIRGRNVCQKTSYTLKNCVCEPTVTKVSCECPTECPKNYDNSKCDSANGILKIEKSVSYFDKSGNCVTDIKEEDKQIKCLDKKIVMSSSANHFRDGGFYNVKTTENEIKKGCECEKKKSEEYILHKCEEIPDYLECVDNKRILKKTFYVKTKETVGKYDYKCVKKEEKVEKKITCSGNSTNIEGKEKSVTYYVIEKCECIPKVEKIPSKCNIGGCQITYCTEDIPLCECNKCNTEADRATCPIRCGICEACRGDLKGCEKNPYDEKYYRKK